MKKIPFNAQNSILALPLFTVCMLLATPRPMAAQHQGVALLVGVGQYQEGSEWRTLNSRNDVILMDSVLRLHGFQGKNIMSLTDAQATKAAISEAIRTHLTGEAQKGGMAVFHFSGHGQQVRDDNGDEADEWDEALVPYDSPMNYLAGRYEGERLLRDDELQESLRQVRKKLGPDGLLLVILDACHSGTGVRGDKEEEGSRGTHVTMAPPGWKPENKIIDSTFLGAYQETTDLAPMVALFSSSPDQRSWETNSGTRYGIFTLAIAQGLASLPERASYRLLLQYAEAQVKAQVNASGRSEIQTPMAEGNLDQLVFGKGIRQIPVSFEVVEQLSPSLIRINAGLLRDVREGDRIAFFPLGIMDTTGQRLLATGIVTDSKGFTSEVELDAPLNEAERGLRAYVRQQHHSTAYVDMMRNLNHSEGREFQGNLAFFNENGQAIRSARNEERIIAKVSNTGTKPFYYRIFIIESTDSIKQMYPLYERDAGDFKVDPGASMTHYIDISPPFGKDQYILIGTETPLQLEQASKWLPIVFNRECLQEGARGPGRGGLSKDKGFILSGFYLDALK